MVTIYNVGPAVIVTLSYAKLYFPTISLPNKILHGARWLLSVAWAWTLFPSFCFKTDTSWFEYSPDSAYNNLFAPAKALAIACVIGSAYIEGFFL